MITKELVEQINALARKQRNEGLTPEEKAEQARLRKVYLAGIRQQVVDQLGPLPQQKKNNGGCSCGCSDRNHKH